MSLVINQRAILIKTNSSTHFISGLVQNAFQAENLTGLKYDYGIIESVTIRAEQNLAFDLEFYSRDSHNNANPDSSHFLGRVVMATTDATLMSGFYTYGKHNLGINYIDDDQTRELHAMLVNRSATAKNAGMSGRAVAVVAVRAEI